MFVTYQQIHQHIRLYPLPKGLEVRNNRIHCTAVLDLHGYEGILEQIDTDWMKPLPKDSKIVLDHPGWNQHYVIASEEDGNGFELKYVTAGELKRLRLPDDASVGNKAAMAYINLLPDDVPIVLYWHYSIGVNGTTD